MSQALTYIYDIYSAFITMVFDTFDIGNGVTIGWIMVAIIIFSLMINNILNLPRSAPSVQVLANRGKKNGK